MSEITKKSGKGKSHGVVSEVSAYMTVKPGHEEIFRKGEEHAMMEHRMKQEDLTSEFNEKLR